jgi:hypothetical protein
MPRSLAWENCSAASTRWSATPGIAHPVRTEEEIDEQWEAVIEVNQNCALRVSRAAFSFLRSALT